MNGIMLTDALKNGCTVWGYSDAVKIRKLKAEHPDWVQIIDKVSEMESILGREFREGDRIPYFCAILTVEGRKHIKKIKEYLEE